MEYISGNFMPNSGEFCRFACYIDTVIDSRILPQNTKFNPFLLAASLSQQIPEFEVTLQCKMKL